MLEEEKDMGWKEWGARGPPLCWVPDSYRSHICFISREYLASVRGFLHHRWGIQTPNLKLI